jgi:2-polyprenyl-3-methyl-5-hydroxy-6-metoxy-1,4-benzoquinol methylase
MIENQKDRFEFGANWANFVDKHFNQERLDISRKQLLEFLGKDSLKELSFLDIGCGSGLHSLAAWQAGAKSIYSFDYDPNSVSTTAALRDLVKAPEDWQVVQGSVLDSNFINSLQPADIVYAWGVLHHTGDVWSAIRMACSRVVPGGIFYLAVYSSDMHIDPPPEYWLDIKRRYVTASPIRRRLIELSYLWNHQLKRKPWRLHRLLLKALRYKKSRGMNFMTDVRDWLGGWPMEFCSDADVIDFVTTEFGMTLEKIKTGQANTEFLFQKMPEK